MLRDLLNTKTKTLRPKLNVTTLALNFRKFGDSGSSLPSLRSSRYPWSAVWLLTMRSAHQAVALVCCQDHPPTHTSRISHTLDAQLTAAVPLVSHSADEAEAVCSINIVRNLTFEHVKPKVCDPEGPCDCRSSCAALLPCALLPW